MHDGNSIFQISQSVINALVARKPTCVIEMLEFLCQYETRVDSTVSPLMAAAVSLHPPDVALPLFEYMLKNLAPTNALFDPNYASPSGESVMHILLAENLPSRSCSAAIDLLLSYGFNVDPRLLTFPCSDGVSLLTHAGRHSDLKKRIEDALKTAPDHFRREALALRLCDLSTRDFEGPSADIESLASRTLPLFLALVLI
jgi:hypothetical protein